MVSASTDRTVLASELNAPAEAGMTDEPIDDGGPIQSQRRVPVPDSHDLKGQLLDRVKATLRDEDMETSVVSGQEITLPPIVIDADPPTTWRSPSTR
jgi:hypothetical protein